MTKVFRDLLVIVISTLGLTFLVWLPHLLAFPNFYFLDFSQGFNIIYRNYDGLNYIIIAKSLYHPEIIANFPTELSDIYYSAHFPGFSLLMLAFAPILGFLKSMLFISTLFTVLSVIALYFLVRDFKLSTQPLAIALFSLILPARALIVHSVGSAEPLFIFLTIAAIYSFMKFEKLGSFYWIILAAIFGALAQLTRPPGILLFGAFGLYILFKLFTKSEQSFTKKLGSAIFNYFPLILMPLTLLGLFYWYQIAYNDFWAYFNSGDNRHLFFPPYQVFNISQYWVGDIWLEDVIYTYLLGFIGCLLLFKKKLYPMAFFVLVYLLASIMVAHRDISRYTLPIVPFVLIAFEKLLNSREFKIALAIVGLAIYLYAQNFILQNTAPVPNLGIYN